MSARLLGWAMNATRYPDVTLDARVVLILLADYASNDTGEAFPSVARIAERVGLSARQVQRALRELQHVGLLEPGDQQLVSHYRADRRPRVWRVVCRPRGDIAVIPDAGVRDDSNVTPDTASRGDNPGTPHGVTDQAPRGDRSGTHGVTPMSPKPRTEPTPQTEPPKPPDWRGPGNQPAPANFRDLVAAARSSG